jgi:hypothetical protein
MYVPLQVTKKLQVTPLVDIRNADCAEGYTYGIWNCLLGMREGTGPVEDRYLVENLVKDIKHGLFDGCHERTVYRSLGFYLGMIHGGVLDPRGQLRRDVTTLVTLSDPDITRGYRAGRECYFLDLEPHELYSPDSYLVDRLHEDVQDDPYPWKHRKEWNFTTGCLLGELSGRLFSWTREEHQAWETNCIKEIGYVCNLNPDCVAVSLFATQRV